MTLTIPISSAKINVLFKAGQLPSIDPANPEFALDLGGMRITSKVNAKAARKLAVHQGGAVLQGTLKNEDGHLVLESAGFTWLDPAPAASETPPNPNGGE